MGRSNPGAFRCRCQKVLFGFVLILLAALPLSAGTAAADIYRFVDKNGVIHYTDDPAKIPPEYEGVVEHRSVTRSPAAPSASSGPMVLTPGKGSDQPAVEQTEQENLEAPGEGAPPPEPEEGGTEVQEAEPTEETESGEPPESPEEGGQEGDDASGQPDQSASLTEPPEAVTAAASWSAVAQRSRLLEEREALLQRQAEMQNDASYQKRKLKRKYQGRPYMKKLIEEEEQIDARLKELDVALR